MLRLRSTESVHGGSRQALVWYIVPTRLIRRCNHLKVHISPSMGAKCPFLALVSFRSRQAHAAFNVNVKADMLSIGYGKIVYRVTG